MENQLTIAKVTTIQPVIKWSGSKRSQAAAICGLAPNFERYFEPFVGGGSIMYALGAEAGFAGDICAPLIDFWKEIQARPAELAAAYRERWETLQKVGPDHFYVVRDSYNAEGNPADLLFLSRTCVNGLIRFNSKGEFNNSFHLSRPGIHPDRLVKIISDWSHRIQGMHFAAQDYRNTAYNAKLGDFVYLDPPYSNTKGRYYGTSTINFAEFFQFLEELNSRGVKWALSFDGRRGDKDYSSNVPESLYKKRHSIYSGNSAFRRVIDKQIEAVFESLYTNF